MALDTERLEHLVWRRTCRRNNRWVDEEVKNEIDNHLQWEELDDVANFGGDDATFSEVLENLFNNVNYVIDLGGKVSVCEKCIDRLDSGRDGRKDVGHRETFALGFDQGIDLVVNVCNNSFDFWWKRSTQLL